MYVFTNTITTLYNLYGYYVKVEIIADAGTTGTLSVDDGGYVISIGDVTEALDDGKGQYKPGSASIKLRNIDNVFSTNVLTDNISEIELRIWLCYNPLDVTPVWECLFAGFINWQSRDWQEVDTTQTQWRKYDLSAYASIVRLRNVPPRFDLYPPDNLEPLASMFRYGTDDAGTAQYLGTVTDIQFASIEEIMRAYSKRIPFVSGAYAPTVDVSVASGGMTLHNTTIGAGVSSSTFTDFLLAYDFAMPSSGLGGYGGGNFTRRGIRTGAYDAENLLELHRRFSESLLLVAVPRLTESGGAYSYTVYMEPFLGVLSGNAVAGSLGEFFRKDGRCSQWYDAIGINTVNLPEEDKTASMYGGKTREITNYFVTSPVSLGGTYHLAYASIIASASSGDKARKTQTDQIGAQQLYFKWGGTVVIAHKFKHLASQSLFESGGVGYYGVQKSLNNLAISDANRSFQTRSVRRNLLAQFKTLRGTDLWDLRVNKTITVDSVTYKIYSTKKSVSRNTTDIEAVQES